MTIKGIRKEGVPSGTKWLSLAFQFFIVPNNCNPNQRGRESLKVMLRCEVWEKV